MFTKIQKYAEQYRYKIKQERKNKKALAVFGAALIIYAFRVHDKSFFAKKTRYKIEYKRDFVAKKLEASKLHKEESYFLCSFFFIF